VAGLVVGASPLGPELEPELVPMFGQFLLEEEPVELLGAVVLVDPEEFVEELLPADELVPVPLAAVEVVEPVSEVLVAALATNAPPATRPLVRAPTAIALRSLSFIGVRPFRLMNFFVLPHMREHHHCAIRICGCVHRRVTTG
jgi:hypothetical protein